MYLRFGDQFLGLRPADGGEHRYYDVGIEHLAFYVDTRDEVDEAHRRCLEIGARIHFPPEEDRDIEGYYELFVFDPDGNPDRAWRLLRRAGYRGRAPARHQRSPLGSSSTVVSETEIRV